MSDKCPKCGSAAITQWEFECGSFRSWETKLWIWSAPCLEMESRGNQAKRIEELEAEVERLRACLTNLRRQIEAYGATVRFNCGENLTGEWHTLIADALQAKRQPPVYEEK